MTTLMLLIGLGIAWLGAGLVVVGLCWSARQGDAALYPETLDEAAASRDVLDRFLVLR